MSYFSDFGAAAFGSLASNVQADIDSERGLKEREKLMEIEEKLRKKAEESRVAAKRMFLQKGDPNGQSPWVSKEAAGYTKGQGSPDQVMVEEFNNMGRPISTRPAAASESEGYLQEQNALAAQQKKAEFDMNRQNVLDNSRLTRDQSAAAADQARVRNLDERTRNPERFRSNPAEPKGPDYDKMIDNANRVLGSIEDPEIKAQLQGKIKEAISVINPADGAPGNAEEAAQMLVIALREARQREAMMGGKKKSTGNSAAPTASGKTLEDK